MISPLYRALLSPLEPSRSARRSISLCRVWLSSDVKSLSRPPEPPDPPDTYSLHLLMCNYHRVFLTVPPSQSLNSSPAPTTTSAPPLISSMSFPISFRSVVQGEISRFNVMGLANVIYNASTLLGFLSPDFIKSKTPFTTVLLAGKSHPKFSICFQEHYPFLRGSSSIEDKLIRPLSFSIRGDWPPVSQPRKFSIFRVRAYLSSMHLVLTKRAMYDHVLVVVLKKVDAMKVSLQSSTLRCPVDWVLFVKVSVVGYEMVKASAKVSSILNEFSDSIFCSLSILEEFANKFCSSFDSILFLMSLNICLCSFFVVVVISIPPDSDLNNALLVGM